MKRNAAALLSGWLRLLCGVAVLAVLQQAAVRAQTAAWPSRTITVVVGFDVGGVTDIMARLFGKSLAKSLGQPVVVENRTGAAGLLAATAVARAAPDGYTLLFAAASQLLAAPKLQGAKLDVAKDFAPITPVGANAFVLAIRPSLPARTIPELVSHARTHVLTLRLAGPRLSYPPAHRIVRRECRLRSDARALQRR